MKRKKLLSNDLLALALACIISLLFIDNVTQFVNNNGKKRNDSSNIFVSQHVSYDEIDVVYLSEATRSIESPAEGIHQSETTFSFQIQSNKFIRAFIVNIALEWKYIQSKPKGLPSLYQFRVPNVWSPSIPIAQRKLII